MLPSLLRGMRMSAFPRPTQFGRIHAPDEDWLAARPPEPILEPELPIIDTHHHLWERPDHRYLLHEFLADVRTGHNVMATVFVGNWLKRIAAGASADDKQALFSGTARRAYRLA
jgi:predicted TIM-barrel fold metal-dependent hydrolase